MKRFADIEKLNAKKLLIAGGVLVTIILIIYFSGKKAGKEENTEIVIPEDLGTPDESKANSHATELLHEMDYPGIFWLRLFHWEPFHAAMEPKDATFLQMISYYNQNYQHKDFMTACLKIKSIAFLQPKLNENVDRVITRAKSMGITTLH